jgi:hydroxymethylpyrimidine/phosphomethylpyrimidine kinase
VVSAQIGAVVTDIGVSATKTGMLGEAAVVKTPGGMAAVRDRLLPLADLVTPNLSEAVTLARWVEIPDDRAGVERLALAVLELGPAAVLVTGGHLPGREAADLLVTRSERRWFARPRVDSPNTHGTGCVLSAAITARLARGDDLVQAIEGAKDFVTAAIAAGVRLGAGPGAVNPSGSSPP